MSVCLGAVLPPSIFLLASLRWPTLQKKNIQQTRKFGSACSLGNRWRVDAPGQRYPCMGIPRGRYENVG